MSSITCPCCSGEGQHASGLRTGYWSYTDCTMCDKQRVIEACVKCGGDWSLFFDMDGGCPECSGEGYDTEAHTFCDRDPKKEDYIEEYP